MVTYNLRVHNSMKNGGTWSMQQLSQQLCTVMLLAGLQLWGWGNCVYTNIQALVTMHRTLCVTGDVDPPGR